MKTFSSFQVEAIADALHNVSKSAFIVEFREGFSVKCRLDKVDDEIAVSTIGWGGATYFPNTELGRKSALKYLID